MQLQTRILFTFSEKAKRDMFIETGEIKHSEEREVPLESLSKEARAVIYDMAFFGLFEYDLTVDKVPWTSEGWEVLITETIPADQRRRNFDLMRKETERLLVLAANPSITIKPEFQFYPKGNDDSEEKKALDAAFAAATSAYEQFLKVWLARNEARRILAQEILRAIDREDYAEDAVEEIRTIIKDILD